MDDQSLIIILVIFLIILIMALSIFSFVFWILMIVDCANRKLPSNEKVMWLLIQVFLGILGSVVYYFAVKRSAK